MIGGYDDAGWTLDGYVLPRLASGLIFGEEIGKGTEPGAEADETEAIACPTEHVNDAGDFYEGCGEPFDAKRDENGYVACPHCGLHFVPR